MPQNPPPETWKMHAVLLGIRAEISNSNISGCFRGNLRILQMIPKDLNESNIDYKGRTANKEKKSQICW